MTRKRVLPILWKHSTQPPQEDTVYTAVTQDEAELLLDQVGMRAIIAIVVIQVGARRSGTICLSDDSYLHYAPEE